MKLDSLTRQVYFVACNEAKLKSHEYVTPEHYLYAALMFDTGKEIIERGGGNVKKISEELSEFLDTYNEHVSGVEPVDSYMLIKLFEMSSLQALNSEKKEISLGDLIVSMLSLSESFGVYILLKNGVNRLTLLRFISHGMRDSKAQKDQNSSETAKKENEILSKYSVNLTDMARLGRLDPLIGREGIIERTLQVLSRRLKNNPVHVGDAGVGKTAIVEGIAQKIAAGDVPKALLGANIYYIDMGSIIAGTKYRGDFEERLIKILDTAAGLKNSIIYIDEIHNVVGAGAVSGGSLDATGLIKPYLTKGGLKFIGSTTYEEYKKYFEKDSALTRRFQKIDIEEPTIKESVQILDGLKAKYEEFHNVRYPGGIITLVCKLCGKYMLDRKLPDKAIDVIDETGAYLRMNSDNDEPITVTQADVEKIISKLAKIPENSVSQNDLEILKNLGDTLNKQIFGQDKAIDTVVTAIKASRSGLSDSDKPVASLLFVGPTGVGKTEIAKQLALSLNLKLVRFDMSEYQEAHSVARLIGAPPGYVGYDEGGLLTEEIRKSPHCVLLLDEIEKAHPDILNILLQIMDYGSLTDNIGKKADFRNVILIMTSNVGAKEIGRNIIGYHDKMVNSEVIDKEVERVFSPEFRNRLDEIVVFNHVNKAMAVEIAKKAIRMLADRLKDKNIILSPSEKCIRWIAEKGMSHKYGAREIIRIVDKEIKKMLADKVLFEPAADEFVLQEQNRQEKVITIDIVDNKIVVV